MTGWPGERPDPRTIGFSASAAKIAMIDSMRKPGESRSSIMIDLIDEAMAARRRQSFVARLWRR
tara:strand:- start:42 stop:233 length:192 start_codon:yes stop_codon:yes gene_type:complete